VKVFMLGWEYPPHISGGLGTACQGLTTALAQQKVEIEFVLPKIFGSENAEHMNLIDSGHPVQVSQSKTHFAQKKSSKKKTLQKKSVNIHEISALLSPYMTAEKYQEIREYLSSSEYLENLSKLIPFSVSETLTTQGERSSGNEHYAGDLFSEVDRYTRNVLAVGLSRDFDLVHAHDWMTYPAGLALAQATGKPLVLHVHSLEFDRSGKNVNPKIHEIERACLHAADRIIAVSYYTREVISREHGIPLKKIEVVHNGVYSREVVEKYRTETPEDAKMVLFLGRITFQKGPDYFVEAAAKVIPLMPEVKFVMAGSGDMLPQIMNRVAELGLTKNFIFTGFLKGQDVEKVFSMADVYIMPSVSEPFGISALEAMSHDIPVIISRQSGVSEVLKNAFKVDFWDVDKLAHFIIGILKYPEIRADIVSMAKDEVRRIHWEAAAAKTKEIYENLIN